MNEPHTKNEHGRPHGKPASWVVVAVGVTAFAAAGAALAARGPGLPFYVCIGVFVLCAPVGLLVGIMDDTVEQGVSEESRSVHRNVPERRS